jgi:hypothetical protein
MAKAAHTRSTRGWYSLADTLTRAINLFGDPNAAKRFVLSKLRSGEWRWRCIDGDGNWRNQDDVPLNLFTEIDPLRLRVVWGENWAYEWMIGGSLYKPRSWPLERRPEIYGIQVRPVWVPSPTPANAKDRIRAEAQQRLDAAPATALTTLACDLALWWKEQRGGRELKIHTIQCYLAGLKARTKI